MILLNWNWTFAAEDLLSDGVNWKLPIYWRPKVIYVNNIIKPRSSMECLLLQSQDVARDFGAVCTPEFYLFKKVFTTGYCW